MHTIHLHGSQESESIMVFRKPAGALGVCTAAVHCILFLYKNGDSVKEAVKENLATIQP
ncbi:hypothetical protein BDR06DRAFT_1015503 [Suillus hirtellus]|nr:hypothetical protein BDR06DRAFT_1015503 [Suillus hirtellus]